MRNHIRYFRKLRGLTLDVIGREIGTTPQTISRLENGAMTLSTDWLERLGTALSVNPTDLLDSPDRRPIPVIGVIQERGFLGPTTSNGLLIDVPSVDPVAVEIGAPLGPFHVGDMLICEKFSGEDLAKVKNQDGLAATREGVNLLCRIIASEKMPLRFSLAPFQAQQTVLYDQELLWAAVLIMRITYL